MKFSIQNLIWLTVVAAVASCLARFLLPVSTAVLVLVWIVLAYAFAPLLLALVSSFFQKISAHKRATAGYYILFLLGILPTFLFAFLSLPFALMFAGMTWALWIIQIEIFAHIHEDQDIAEFQAEQKKASNGDSARS